MTSSARLPSDSQNSRRTAQRSSSPIGTGRVAIPLRNKGVPVTGIELSEPMIAKLRTKADEATVPVTQGDMATTRVPGEFSVVYLVYNTIMNLQTQDEQVACFVNAAAHLRPAGCFVVEVGVPDLRALPHGRDGVVFGARDRLPRCRHL